MRLLIYSFFTFLLTLAFTVEGYSQCTSGCTTTISPAGGTTYSTAITVSSGTTCIVANSGDITISGTVLVQGPGTLCINANGGNITFTGTVQLDPQGIINVYSSGSGKKVTMTGYFDSFTAAHGGGAIDDRYFNNYGNLSVEYYNCATPCGWRLYKSTHVVNNPGATMAIKFDAELGAGSDITNKGTMTIGGYVQGNSSTSLINTSTGNLSVTGNINMTGNALTNAGTMTVGGTITSGSSSVFTNSGNLNVTGAMNWVGTSMTNSGPLTVGGDFMTAGLPFTNSATLTIGGSWSMNTNLVLTNTAPINVAKDLTFYGNYTQSSTVTVGGLLTFNAGSIGNISGGRFYSKTLIFNAAQVTATSGTCAAFITQGTTAVQASTFKAMGNVGLVDLSDPGGIDTNNCAASPGYCGLKLATSEGTSVCPNPSLPVSLISFKGKYLSEDHVELIWTTASEKNNSQFIIERTEDLKKFTPVGFVKGAGNTHENTSYRFIDNQVGGPEIYYRLKQQDENGSIQNLGIILPDRPDGEFIVEVFPNPNKGQFKIAAFGDYKIYHIHLLDNSGKVVYTVNNVSSNFEKTFDVSLEGLKGMYILEVGTEEAMFYNKIHIE